MSDKKIIFKTGSINYPKEWYLQNGIDEKPVKYTEQFLKEIASNTIGSSLELTHGNNSIDAIGYVNNFDFIGDELVANVSTNESLNDMGFSPEFSANFIDKGEFYEAVDGKLLRTILTDTPRSHILCNSVAGGSNMEDKTIDILNKRISELERENNKLESKNSVFKEKAEKYDELQSKVETLEKDNLNYKAQIEALKPKADAYKEIEDSKRGDLLDKAFGNDEEAKKAFAEASLSELEILAKHKETVKPPEGVQTGAAEGEGEGDDTGEDEPSPMDKAIETYKKNHNGELPSYLKGGE